MARVLTVKEVDEYAARQPTIPEEERCEAGCEGYGGIRAFHLVIECNPCKGTGRKSEAEKK